MIHSSELSGLSLKMSEKAAKVQRKTLKKPLCPKNLIQNEHLLLKKTLICRILVSQHF